jgi:leader peptidase (prepilin peptidase)/N-methyltransferase
MTSAAILPLGLMVVGVLVGPVLGIIADRAIDRSQFGAEHRCTVCSAGLGPASLIPVASWRDRCWSCQSHKGWIYPLIDGATATTFALLGLRFGVGWMLVPYLGLAAILIVLSVIDAKTHLLPNEIVWPSFLAGLFVIFVISGQQDYANGIYSALLGAAVFAGFIGAAHLAYEPGMGRGDVKLSLTLGLFLGWLQPGLIDTTRLVLSTIFVALVGGGVGGLIYNLVRSRGRAEIPFGPALAVATLASVLISGSVLDTVSL